MCLEVRPCQTCQTLLCQDQTHASPSAATPRAAALKPAGHLLEMQDRGFSMRLKFGSSMKPAFSRRQRLAAEVELALVVHICLVALRRLSILYERAAAFCAFCGIFYCCGARRVRLKACVWDDQWHAYRISYVL